MPRHRVFLSVLLTSTMIAGNAVAESISVSDGGSIQAAVNRAKPGDTIVVDSGTYAPFQITKNGITVKSAVPGGAHVVASGSNQPAVSAYGQSNIGVFDFRITSNRGDGVKITGAPGEMVRNVRVEGNTIEKSYLDGVKLAQVDRASVIANQIKQSGSGGTAGGGGNRNGDGGIDWVQVTNSEMSDNEVNSNGWACAMVKGGSANNLIADNDLNQCAVNGIDMAAETSGAADDANGSGMIAYDSTIEGNTISSGGCGIKLGDRTKNIKIDSAQAGGAECIAGEGNGQTASGAGDGVGTGQEGGNGIEDVTATLASSGGDGDVCSSGAMSKIGGAANAILSMIGGGRATAKGQQIQLVELIRANLCAGEQNDKLEDQLSEQRRMNARIRANAARNIREIEQGAREAIGSVDEDLYGANADTVLRDRYQAGMPDGWSFAGAASHSRDIREQTDRATREAAIAGASSHHAVGAALEASDEALDLSQVTDGVTGAIQAQTQMLRAQIGVMAAQHVGDTASETAKLRIEEERRASEVIADQKMERFWARNAGTAAPARRAVFE